MTVEPAPDGLPVTTLADGVLRIRWHDPERLNALTVGADAAAAAAIEGVGEQVRVVVVTGTGRAFSSGASLQDDRDDDAGLLAGYRLIRAVLACPVPVVCAVNGLAAGVAVAVVAAADVSVACRSSSFLLAFTKVGLMPDGGLTRLLAASVGRARASAMVLLGDHLSAEQALRAGLVYRVVEDDQLGPEVERVVAVLAGGPPLALAAAKRTLLEATLPDLEASLEVELEGQRRLLATADFRAGVAAFREKRRAVFTGR